MNNNYNAPSSLNIDPRLAALLCYIPIVGVVFFFVENKNRYVKFHAAQSMLISVIMIVLNLLSSVLGAVPILGAPIAVLLNIASGFGGLVLIVIGMIKAWGCEWYRFPIIGDMALQLSSKVS